jgi:hypothetical protein
MNYLDNSELQEFGASAAGRVRASSGKFYKRKSPQGKAITTSRKARAKA